MTVASPVRSNLSVAFIASSPPRLLRVDAGQTFLESTERGDDPLGRVTLAVLVDPGVPLGRGHRRHGGDDDPGSRIIRSGAHPGGHPVEKRRSVRPGTAV